MAVRPERSVLLKLIRFLWVIIPWVQLAADSQPAYWKCRNSIWNDDSSNLNYERSSYSPDLALACESEFARNILLAAFDYGSIFCSGRQLQLFLYVASQVE